MNMDLALISATTQSVQPETAGGQPDKTSGDESTQPFGDVLQRAVESGSGPENPSARPAAKEASEAKVEEEAPTQDSDVEDTPTQGHPTAPEVPALVLPVEIAAVLPVDATGAVGNVKPHLESVTTDVAVSVEKAASQPETAGQPSPQPPPGATSPAGNLQNQETKAQQAVPAIQNAAGQEVPVATVAAPEGQQAGDEIVAARPGQPAADAKLPVPPETEATLQQTQPAVAPEGEAAQSGALKESGDGKKPLEQPVAGAASDGPAVIVPRESPATAPAKARPAVNNQVVSSEPQLPASEGAASHRQIAPDVAKLPNDISPERLPDAPVQTAGAGQEHPPLEAEVEISSANGKAAERSATGSGNATAAQDHGGQGSANGQSGGQGDGNSGTQSPVPTEAEAKHKVPEAEQAQKFADIRPAESRAPEGASSARHSGNDHSAPGPLAQQPPGQGTASRADRSDFRDTQPSAAPGLWETADAPASRFVTSARLLERMNGAEMRVAFRSDSLGPVELRAVLHGESVGASISLENRDARTMLANELPRLEQALAEKNVRLENITISQGAMDAGASGSGKGSHSEPFAPPARYSYQPFGGLSAPADGHTDVIPDLMESGEGVRLNLRV